MSRNPVSPTHPQSQLAFINAPSGNGLALRVRRYQGTLPRFLLRDFYTNFVPLALGVPLRNGSNAILVVSQNRLTYSSRVAEGWGCRRNTRSDETSAELRKLFFGQRCRLSHLPCQTDKIGDASPVQSRPLRNNLLLQMSPPEWVTIG